LVNATLTLRTPDIGSKADPVSGTAPPPRHSALATSRCCRADINYHIARKFDTCGAIAGTEEQPILASASWQGWHFC
jgi:hypothetical protein